MGRYTDFARNAILSGRPHQWVKNLLVFAVPFSDGLIFGSRVSQKSILFGIALFCSLSFISSANYIINDLRDKSIDMNSLTKSCRPIASGKISVKQSLFAATIFTGIGTLITLVILPSKMLIVVLGFGVIQLIYTIVLKHHIGFDIATLAVLYVYRVLAPLPYEDTIVSSWFLMAIFSTSLILAVGKRMSELQEQFGVAKTRRVLTQYSENQLYILLAAAVSLLLISYLNWTLSQESNSSVILSLTSFLPLLITVVRLTSQVTRPEAQDPTLLIIKDKTTLLMITLWAFLYLASKGFL